MFTTKRINSCWSFGSLLLLVALLLAACGGGEEAADAPQGEQAAEVDAGETEEEETTRTAVCVVPDVVGFDQANAERMVQGVGLVPVRRAEFSAEVPEGQVIAQEPAGDTRLDPCAGEVSIVVSLGADDAGGGTPAAEELADGGPTAETAEGQPIITADNADRVGEVATLRNQGNAMSIAFSPDGQVLASGSFGGTVTLWDVASGTEITTLEGIESRVTSVAFSPDGQLLAAAGGAVTLWDVANGTKITTLVGHKEDVISVAFSPDGQVLASGSLDETVKLWDVNSGSEITTLRGHELRVPGVTFNPDGQVLASGSADTTVKLWDVDSATEITTFQGRASVAGVAFSPDGQLLAAAGGAVTLWDVANGTKITTLVGYEEDVISVAFSPDGQVLASGSRDETVKLWDVANGTEITTLRGHGDWVTNVAFSPDGQVLASAGGTVKLWAVGEAPAKPAAAEIAAISDAQEAILGRWAAVRGPEGIIEREPGRPDYDFAFYADGTMESISVQMTFGEEGTTEYPVTPGDYEFVENGQLRIDDGDRMQVEVTLDGDRMTWVMDGVEVELERIGPAE